MIGWEGVVRLGTIPVVRDSDNCLQAFVADELDLIFNVQNGLVTFLPGCIPYLALHSARVSLFSILAQIGKQHPLFFISIYWCRALEVFLAPPFSTAM